LAVCNQGRTVYPEDVEILFQEALAMRSLGDLPGAAQRWEQILHTPAGDHFSSMNVGIRGYISRHNLAHTYQDLGRLADAEAQWRAVLLERPDFAAAWFAIGEMHLTQRRWSDLEELACLVERQARGAMDAELFRGRVS